jgi:hypothetical protein
MMSRFCRYVDKVFDLSPLVETLRDGRPQPQISTQTVWYSAFEMFATHRRSLNAWECVARPAKRPRHGAGRGPPSADTIGEVFACLDSGPLREMLKRILLQLKRNKALQPHGPFLFLALDGHEFFSQSTSPV